MRFEEFDLEDPVLEGILSMGFTETTPIQETTMPALLQGKDLLGVAQTGTGKTAAYLLPIINRIYRGEFPQDEVKALIVAPTRELVQQIDRQVQGFGYFTGCSSIAIYGGTDGVAWEQQSRSTRLGVDIIVATPGRLLDLINTGSAEMSNIRYFVLDEADRMLDMGFYDDIVNIRKSITGDCQIAMFSATMPTKIATLAEALLHEPVKVELAVAKPPESIMQCAYFCYETQKLGIIDSLYENEGDTKDERKSVFFASTKRKVHLLASNLARRGFNVAEMHSDLEQSAREQVMRDFKGGYVSMLVATDIVARGIDIDDIEVVVNFDMPHDAEDYVHRVGRTARGSDGRGIAITLVTEDDFRAFADLERFLGKKLYVMPIDPELGDAPEYRPDALPTRSNGSRRPNRSAKRGRGKKRNNRRSSRKGAPRINN